MIFVCKRISFGVDIWPYNIKLGVEVVFFVISRKGFEDYLAVTEECATSLWISANVISQSELESLRRSGAEITDFNYAIELNETEVIEDAIETIKEHHSGEVIWLQR